MKVNAKESKGDGSRDTSSSRSCSNITSPFDSMFMFTFTLGMYSRAVGTGQVGWAAAGQSSEHYVLNLGARGNKYLSRIARSRGPGEYLVPWSRVGHAV